MAFRSSIPAVPIRGVLLFHSYGEVFVRFTLRECFADQIRYVHTMTEGREGEEKRVTPGPVALL